MAQMVRDIMTPEPVAIRATDTLVDAARCMRDQDIGDVLVLADDGTACGILTDRDVVVRGLAAGSDPAATQAGKLCTTDLVTLSPTDSVDHAVELMRQRAIRRMPVMEQGRPIGIISLGDLALQKDPGSALGDISSAPPNN